MHFVGRLDRKIYQRITKDIATDEVIITDERIHHIKERRGADFWGKYSKYFPLIISDPDYIFPDDRSHTAIVCKTVGNKEESVNLVLRLIVTGDNSTYKNSILTAVLENKKRFAQRLRNNIPIYKFIKRVDILKYIIYNEHKI